MVVYLTLNNERLEIDKVFQIGVSFNRLYIQANNKGNVYPFVDSQNYPLSEITDLVVDLTEPKNEGE